jgi:16S rRNA U516 pseudouridylate synthase RsuA-like enzyme
LRREADELIKKGLIKVGGKVVTDLSIKVTFEDKMKTIQL